MQQWKKILVLGLFVLVIGGAMAFAGEPVDEQVPPRGRIWEILQEHPEVLSEIQAAWEELRLSATRDDDPRFTGMMPMQPRMMRSGQVQNERVARRQQMRACSPQGGPGFMMGPRWTR